MNLRVSAIDRVADNAYRLTLEAGRRTVVYVVTVAEQPVPAMQAPDSLWQLLDNEREPIKNLVDAVFQVHWRRDLALPVIIRQPQTSAAAEASDLITWPVRTGRWNLSKTSLRWAVGHLATQRANTLFPVPFEQKLLASAWDSFEGDTAKVDLLEHRLSGHRQIVAPKSSAGSRMATQLDPLDAILMTAAVYEVGETVERARISPSEGIVHSFRFAPTPHGVLWDRSASYNSFRQRSVELAESPGVAVVAETDIANFYHSIPADAIANSLERVGVDARRAQGFYGLLCSFFRTGLPVGPSCSALLAESVLIATDEQLLRRGCRFVRFNDDYKLFGRTEAEVRGHLRSLADALWQTARLDLNASKTRISETEQFAKDTKRERDNWLSRLAALFAQDDPYGTTESSVAFTPGLSSLVQSAKALLLNAIDEQHPAWTRLYRQAFGALPPTQRLEMVPRLLPELARVWDLAPKIALSLRAAPTVGTERRSQVFAAVLSGLAPQSAETEGVPPYAAMWVLSGMGRNGWYDGPELLKLGGCFPQDSPAQRELLLALSGRDDLGQIRFSRADPWHRRAYEWASGAAISYPQLMSDNGPPSPWHKLLERLITESGARELAIGDF